MYKSLQTKHERGCTYDKVEAVLSHKVAYYFFVDHVTLVVSAPVVELLTCVVFKRGGKWALRARVSYS